MNFKNANEHKCNRKWTREQRKERSKIDYVITSQEYLETIKIMETVEEKQNGSYKIKLQIKQIKKTYSGHNAVLINIDFISSKDAST